MYVVEECGNATYPFFVKNTTNRIVELWNWLSNNVSPALPLEERTWMLSAEGAWFVNESDAIIFKLRFGEW